MWSQYDEDLSQNDFFKEIKQDHSDILKRAAEEHWIICIPRSGSFRSEDISMKVILDHVLIQSNETSYITLSKNEICLENRHLKVDQNNIFHSDIEVLFEETHYIEQTSKYLVWCVNWPLFSPQNQRRCTNNNIILVSVQDCIDFLYSEAFGYNLLEGIHNLCVNFWKNNENVFEMESLQSQKDYLGNLYSQCLQLCFKHDFIRDKCHKNVTCLDNFKLSIETYMQYCLGKKLMYSINTLQHFTDCMVNKTVRNSVHMTLSDLNISKDFSDLVLEAKCELSRINNFVTVLDKVHCLSRTFNIFNNKLLQNDQKIYITSDDFLQILVFLILKSNIPNWVANLIFLTEFQFSTFGTHDPTNFLVSTLEAAIAFIKSSQFLDIKQRLTSYDNDESLIFNKLYRKFKENRNITELDELLVSEKQRNKTELCHPLCSCLKCENIMVHKSDEESYKILNSSSQSFLIIACIENDLNFLQFLLPLDFNLNLKDSSGKTALHYAAEKGFQDILLLLINANINVNILDNEKNTALHLACDRGHENCVKALIYSSHFVEINLQNMSGETPLFLATRWGYFDIIKILLENGASVCIKNNRNMIIYKLSPNYYITKLYRQFGTQKSNIILEEVIKDDLPSISEPCHNKICNSFQEQGIVFGMQTKTFLELKKIKLLLKAIINNDLPLTCFYLGYSGNSLQDRRNENVMRKCHPLCACTQCSKRDDSEDSTDSSLEQNNYDKDDCKINVNMCNTEGDTPLHVAAQYGRTEILRVLLDSGALLNVRNNKTFYTPLHLAVVFQRVQAVKELLMCGKCDVDARDSKGFTPLYYACIRNSNNLKIVKYLLQNGADCQKKTFQEKTILQICEEKNLFRICRMLRESMGHFLPKTKDGDSSYNLSNVSFESIDSDFEFL